MCFNLCATCYDTHSHNSGGSLLTFLGQVNARHYRRDVEDGVPRRTPLELETGLKEQFAIRRREVPKDPVCM